MAVSLVTEHCSSDDYTSTRLNQIALWLSAHFYTVRDPRAEMEKAGLLQKGGPFKKAASLFGEISGHCKDLEGELALSEEFFKNLAN